MRFELAATAVTAAAQAAAEVTAGGQAAEDEQGLGPPAGQNKVGVDVLLSELLGHVQPQGTVFVVDVLLGGVHQDGVGVIDFLKLLCCFGVVRVFVWVKLQCQLPVAFLDVLRSGVLVDPEHGVQRFS